MSFSQVMRKKKNTRNGHSLPRLQSSRFFLCFHLAYRPPLLFTALRRVFRIGHTTANTWNFYRLNQKGKNINWEEWAIFHDTYRAGGRQGNMHDFPLFFLLFSSLFYNKRKHKAWQCDILYVMPAAFLHTSSFPGDEPLTAEPLQLLLLTAVQKQLPHAGLLQLGHRYYNIWDCVTSLQGFCGPFTLPFFDETWNIG